MFQKMVTLSLIDVAVTCSRAQKYRIFLKMQMIKRNIELNRELNNNKKLARMSKYIYIYIYIHINIYT